MSIRQEIAAWDGQSAKDIRAVYERYASSSSFVSEVVGLTQHASLQNGATWLLKRHAETTGRLPQNAIEAVYRVLRKLEHWEAKLHVLQCLPHMPISEAHKIEVEAFLRACLADEAKFVRAWAYSGMRELAVQYPEYREEVGQLFERALRDESASVKARVRAAMRSGF